MGLAAMLVALRAAPTGAVAAAAAAAAVAEAAPAIGAGPVVAREVVGELARESVDSVAAVVKAQESEETEAAAGAEA